MRSIKLIFLWVTFFLAIAGLHAQDISPYLFGQNHWMDRGDEGSRPGYLYMLWPKIAESGISMVRIGGNGYERRFPDRKTLNAMIDSIREIGAEPLLQVPRNFTGKEAAELVRNYKYTNGKGIRFYSIGNEPLLHDRDGIQKVYDYIKKLAPVMKEADPSIRIFVFDECDLFFEQHKRIIGGDLDLTGKDENGHWMIDGITFHRYPFGENFGRDDVIFGGSHDIRSKAKILVDLMEVANKKHGRSGNERLLWGLTEVNVTYINPDRDIAGFGNPSFLGGQFIAEVYGIGMEYGAFTVDPWCLVETDRVRTDFGFLGLPSEFLPRSSFYHTQMMSTHMKGEFLPSRTSNSYVKSIATKGNNEMVVMLLNRDQLKDFEFDIILNKEGDSPKPLVINVDAGMEKIITGTIPNQTTMMFVLSGSGEVLKQYIYGLKHNLDYLPPEIKQRSE